jgi:hypothetical protein
MAADAPGPQHVDQKAEHERRQRAARFEVERVQQEEQRHRCGM